MIRLYGQSTASSQLDAFNVTRRLVATADMIGPILRSRIAAAAPRGRGENAGRLAGSVRYRRRTGIMSVRMEFHAEDVPYAPFVIKGTKPHQITAKAARTLHWVNPGGADIFRRTVHHPGTKPNPFPRRAAEPMMPWITAAFLRAFRS